MKKRSKPAPGIVPVTLRVRSETAGRIHALSAHTGIRKGRLVDQLLSAALDLREAAEAKAGAR